MHLLQCFSSRQPPTAAPSSADTLGRTSLVVDCRLVPSSPAAEAMNAAIVAEVDRAVTYLRGTYAAGFSVFDAEPKQHADLCTPRMRSQTQ